MNLPPGFIVPSISNRVRALRAGVAEWERKVERIELRHKQEGLKIELWRKDLKRYKAEVNALEADCSFRTGG